MLVGPFPATTTSQTWYEEIEWRDAQDDSLLDLSTSEEVTLIVQEIETGIAWIKLTKSDGNITFPSVGIMAIRAEKDTMAGLPLQGIGSKTYILALTIQANDTDFVQLILGTLPVLNGVVQ